MPPRYPALVSAVAIVVAGASIVLAPGIEGMFGALLGLVMIAIADFDRREGLIPDALNAAAVLAGLTAHTLAGYEPGSGVGDALLRAVVASGALWAVREIYYRLRGRDGLGLGDVKLAAVAGVWLDWLTIILAVDLAAISALIVNGYKAIVQRRPMDSTAIVPFGLYLAPAIWLGWVYQVLTR